MKKIFKLSIILLLVLSSSCSKDWLSVNSDPNSILSAPDSLVFPSGVASVATVIGGQYAIMGGIWCQYFTQNNTANQYKDLDGFNITTTTMDDQWDELYAGALKDFKYVREQAQQEGNWQLVLMSTVMEAYTYQLLVDLYDQIPYNEALLGSSNMSPHYIPGQQVYDSLIMKIDAAKKLDFSAKTSRNPGSEDFLFEGDLTSWQQFANTLKLKIFLRQCYARPTITSAGIAAMISDPNFEGFLTTNAAITQYLAQNLKDNPMYEENIRTSNFTGNLAMSNTFYSWLNLNNDTFRLFKLFLPGDGGYAALVQGDFLNPNSDSKLWSVFRESPTDPVYFMTAAESYFLQAEAILKGYITTGTVKAAYDNGVLSAYEQLGIADSIAEKYIGPGGVYEYKNLTLEANLEQIIVQKWASMAGTHGLEAYIEHTRTHYPKESAVSGTDPSYIPGQWPLPKNASIKSFPKRLLFTDHEKDRNRNTPAEVPVTTPVWWDKNTTK